MPEDALSEVCQMVRGAMEGAMRLRVASLDLEVPLRVKCHAGRDWGNLREVGRSSWSLYKWCLRLRGLCSAPIGFAG